MTTAEKLAIARKISLLLDKEKIEEPKLRAQILVSAAALEVGTNDLTYLVSGRC
jgi:hypothetical protein